MKQTYRYPDRLLASIESASLRDRIEIQSKDMECE